jgi:ATP-dependent protease ClpP protease subunit
MTSLIWSARKRARQEEDEEAIHKIDIGQLFGSLFEPKALRRGMASDNIYTIDNNIYFQDDITMDSVSALNREMRHLQTKLLEMGTAYSIEPPPIRLHMTTYGGSIFAAMSAIDCIREMKVKVHSICDGYVASAGTIISVVCDRRFIKKNAHMLIHELRSDVWGKMSDIDDEHDNLKKLMAMIKKIYVEHTKLKKAELTDILKHDKNWNAQECLEKGLVDEVL